jgi:PDDEXK-like domain of unknown function (DUF3799)
MTRDPAGYPAMSITEPGIYPDMTADEYHADPCILPSLSAGVACALVYETPFHAVMKHRRLRAELLAELDEPEPEEEMQNGVSRLGSIAHELLLGRGSGYEVITETVDSKGNVVKNPTAYSHADTKRQRDEIVARGGVPCLVHEIRAAEEIVSEVLSSVRQIGGCEHAFDPEHGRSEVAVFWQESHLSIPVWGRCLVDWWSNDGHLYDLKTTGRDLSDEALERKIDQEHLDMRAAWYLRGVEAVHPLLRGRIDYRLVFAQQQAPFMSRVITLDKNTIYSGQKKIAYALMKWAHHLRRGHFPGYPNRIETMTMPKWAANRWADREGEDPVIISAILNDPVVSSITTESRSQIEFTEVVS